MHQFWLLVAILLWWIISYMCSRPSVTFSLYSCTLHVSGIIDMVIIFIKHCFINIKLLLRNINRMISFDKDIFKILRCHHLFTIIQIITSMGFYFVNITIFTLLFQLAIFWVVSSILSTFLRMQIFFITFIIFILIIIKHNICNIIFININIVNTNSMSWWHRLFMYFRLYFTIIYDISTQIFYWWTNIKTTFIFIHNRTSITTDWR